MSQLLQQRTIKETFRIKMSQQDVATLLTAAYMAEVKYRGMTYQENSHTTEAIKKMAEALTTESHKSGILMCGTCGNGKTTLLRALQNALIYLKRNVSYELKQGIIILDAREIASKIAEAKNYPLLAIEDMGKEPTQVLDYGNVLNPVIEVLEHRYNEQLFTVITTNLTPKEIREKYGARIADRFNEMMNVIVFNGSSFRK